MVHSSCRSVSVTVGRQRAVPGIAVIFWIDAVYLVYNLTRIA
jgi:hypothetical protein